MALDLSGGYGQRLDGGRILVWCSDVPGRIAGLEVWRRAVYTACRAGFERVLIVAESDVEGIRGALAGDHRLAGRCWEVLGRDGAWPERIVEAGGRWVVLDARWVTGDDHLRELAATQGPPASAERDGPMAADAADLARAAEEGWTPSTSWRATGGRRLAEPAVFVRLAAPRDLREAEDALFRSLAQNVTNAFARHVDRAMSRAISRRIAPLPITPNQITLFSIAVGVAGGLLLLLPGYWPGLVGSLLFLGSTIVDGCDGEIARLKFQESPLGAKLDIVGDNVVHAVLFPCVALHAHVTDPSGPYLALGAVSLAGVVVTWLVVYLLVVRGRPSGRLLAFFEAFGNREFAYLFFVLGVIGKLHWFVWGMAIGLWVFPFGLVALWLAERGSTSRAPGV